MKNEFVSVVIPTHNRCADLRAAIESVLTQSYGKLECIVVDDGSTDATPEMVRQLEDSRVKYMRLERGQGGARARNAGLAIASSDRVAFLDDDDIWLPEKLERQVRLLDRNHKAGAVFCGVERIFEAGDSAKEDLQKLVRGDASRLSLMRVICLTSTLMVDRSRLPMRVEFDEKLKYWQEKDLMIRICQFSEVDFVPAHLVRYRMAVGHRSMTGSIQGWQENREYFHRKHAQLYANLSSEEMYERDFIEEVEGLVRATQAGDIGAGIRCVAALGRHPAKFIKRCVRQRQ